MDIVYGLLALLIGIAIGMKIADLDFLLPLTKHRSFLTHGLIFPLLLFGLTTEQGYNLLGQLLSDEMLAVVERTNMIYYFVSGFCLTYGVHLVFDMYPKKWHGIAKIHTPFGRMPGPLSWLWLGLGVVASLLLMIIVLKSDLEWAVAGAGIAFAFFYVSRREDSTWLPLVTLIGAAACSFLLWDYINGGVIISGIRI